MTRSFEFAAAMAILLVGACQSVAPTHNEARLRASSFPVPEVRRAIARAGSELEFKFFSAPELNDRQVVRPDGFVSLQLVGDVSVDGKSAREIRQDLLERYAGHLRDPEVVVILRRQPADQIVVAGEVRQPQALALTGEMSVLDAVLLAGGPNATSANMRHVLVIREHDGKRAGYPLDLGPSLAGADAVPFYLQPRDIVWVPQTEITQVNAFIDQYINNVIPLGFTYVQPAGKGEIGINTGLVRR